MKNPFLPVAALLACALPHAALAQSDDGQDRAPWRYRVALGPQVVPRYPGSDDLQWRPLIDLSRVRGDRPFDFEAADESAGFALIKTHGLSIGPSLNVEGARRRRHVGADIDEVGTTVELGGYAEYWITPGFRFHGEVRQGVNGHKGLVSNLGADFVARDGDRWLFSLGPRVTLADGKYQRAYFGVSPRVNATTGLPQYSPGGGVSAVGATAGALYQFTPRWGVYGYAKYDRLIDDAGDSPLVRAYGDRNQLSGGLALTFTFGKGIR
jgi:MipA family protein